MKIDFKMRFPLESIREYSAKYDSGNRYLPGEAKMQREILSAVKKRKFLSKEEFLFVCRWKTPRSASKCNRNSREFIMQSTQVALSSSSCEEIRIGVLTLLAGVDWPTASVFLHFFHTDPYPILDARALWSLGIDRPPHYTLDFWLKYTGYCREQSAKAGVPMRSLDRALWQFSAEKQGSLRRAVPVKRRYR